MENNYRRSLEVLNGLIEINNYRIEGYELAAKEIDGSTLRSLFTRFAENSRACKHELCEEIKRTGSFPREEKTTAGEIHKAWLDVKAALAHGNRKALLKSCEDGESVAERSYLNALENNGLLIIDHHVIVKRQYAIIRSDHEKIKNLKNALLAFH